MHFTEYDIASYIERTFSKKERKAFEAHLADCSTCAGAVASAVATLREAKQVNLPSLYTDVFEGVKQIVRPKRTSFFTGVLRVAAVLAAMVGVGYWIVSMRSSPEAHQFRPLEGEIRLETLSPSDNADIRSLPVTVQWKSINNVIRYRVSVFTGDGIPLWQEETISTELSVPPPVAFQKGYVYLWKVEAWLTNGSTVSSDLRAFRYSP